MRHTTPRPIAIAAVADVPRRCVIIAFLVSGYFALFVGLLAGWNHTISAGMLQFNSPLLWSCGSLLLLSKILRFA